MNDGMQKREAEGPFYDGDEIDLLELAKIIWDGRKLIASIVLLCVAVTVVVSLLMKDIYTAQAVLKPTSPPSSGGKLSALASQFSGLATLAGIAMPAPSSSTEIVKLLQSNILKKEVIENYQLLPVLFPGRWDEAKKQWKEGGIWGTDIPTVWDGIRKLDDVVTISYNAKDDIITVSADFPDPQVAAKLVSDLVMTLNEHMSSEAKRMAVVNKEYLEKQLLETQDSLVQQKIYNLIAEKIETMMMAEVKEGFAFKVLDPPMVPDERSKPKRIQMAAVSFILSLFAGGFVVLFREYIRKVRAKSAGGINA